MPTIQHITLPNTTLHIHEFSDVSDPTTGKALTGAWVWSSAVTLSRHIALHDPKTLQGKTVLELGAGTGLPGLTAAHLGASRVVLSDVAALLPILRRNVEENGLEGRVEVREIVWGEDEVELEKVDVVLMSDVFYEVEEMEGLGRTLRGVCGAETVGLAASEVRESTWGCLEVLGRCGFEVTMVVCEGEVAVYKLVPTQDL